MIQGVPLQYFLILSTIMFFTGIFGFITRRNMITMLMSIELVLNSVNINFVAFNKYLYPDKLQGNFYSLFIIAIAAAEAAVVIAIIINVYRHYRSIGVEEVEELKY
jgi:NADH:ubiquinone oxidoreductase subunit K